MSDYSGRLIADAIRFLGLCLVRAAWVFKGHGYNTPPQSWMEEEKKSKQ